MSLSQSPFPFLLHSSSVYIHLYSLSPVILSIPLESIVYPLSLYLPSHFFAVSLTPIFFMFSTPHPLLYHLLSFSHFRPCRSTCPWSLSSLSPFILCLFSTSSLYSFPLYHAKSPTLSLPFSPCTHHTCHSTSSFSSAIHLFPPLLSLSSLSGSFTFSLLSPYLPFSSTRLTYSPLPLRLLETFALSSIVPRHALAPSLLIPPAFLPLSPLVTLYHPVSVRSLSRPYRHRHRCRRRRQHKTTSLL